MSSRATTAPVLKLNQGSLIASIGSWGMKPLADYVISEGSIEQRVSIFEGGLVVVKMTGAASIQKKVVIPPDALAQYLRNINVAALKTIDGRELVAPGNVRTPPRSMAVNAP